MKKLIIYGIFITAASFSSILKAQSVNDIQDLKAKKEVLKLNMKLNDERLNLEKKKKDHENYLSEVKSINSDADKMGDKFDGKSNAERNTKEARKAAKRMKTAEKANKKLASIEKDIEKKYNKNRGKD